MTPLVPDRNVPMVWPQKGGRHGGFGNSKIAVARFVGSRERKAATESLRLKSHFLFEDHFCLVRRPNEKGHVERLLDFARRNYLVPVPRVDSLTTLNCQLAEHCRDDLTRQLRGKPSPKQTLLAEEQQSFLRPLPEQTFEARRLGQANADSLSLVRFDTNSYSVPAKYAYRKITIAAAIDEVRLIFEDRLIARHRRHWGREQFFFDPVHYLALLERGHRPQGGRRRLRPCPAAGELKLTCLLRDSQAAAGSRTARNGRPGIHQGAQTAGTSSALRPEARR